ncbi:gluconate 2-dehydrogenase subunit 3 family protein [Roseisolibacter sp. H3M3-2]|uniref:gluconate 2-dehydrogenase subunit 3 family protein n=1 Tax=Roseisolibacter sp. H3M3-2 TaxID=3031323 RepID=UPI0023D99CE1|nr:gluconate 2-dehydrogenase subunit 3 family protein [Roseisolibacter sp. H3M3-2]MDF1501623.1 gluconate 2-dehydrogenase subunit 3 family protein [Roseisolibacter sp. H3M3-2]
MSDQVSRRQALKVLSVLPLAGVVEAQQPAQPPQAPRQPHATPNQPAAGAAQPPANAAQRKFFTAREWRTVGVLADDVIPRDERSGSATDAGVPAYIDFNMSVPETDENARTQMRGGLRWIDAESRRRFGVDYHRASQAQRHQVLDDVAGPPAQAKPEFRHGAAFFNTFRNMVASGFFSSAIGWKDLQYQGNVFNPAWNGCPQPALDKLGVSYDVMTTRVAPQRAGTE